MITRILSQVSNIAPLNNNQASTLNSKSIKPSVKIGITSLQKNRNPYIIEWVAFHLCMGFNQFYIYAHQCTDGMVETLKKLAVHYPIVIKEIFEDTPQIPAYLDSARQHLPNVDWMAYIDGDEFLFPVQHDNIAQALQGYNDKSLSALGAYWICYGSSGHLQEPTGLITENFTRHSHPDFKINRHVKTIVKGGLIADAPWAVSTHVFETPHGTVDELLRPIAKGWSWEHEPSHTVFRINHYVTQSYDFYRHKKRFMGAADVSPDQERDASWFTKMDRNECDDGVRYLFLLKLKIKIEEMMKCLLDV